MLIRSLPLRGPSDRRPTRQPHVNNLRPAQLLGQQQHGNSRLHAAADDASNKGYNPDELADYEDILRQKKADKQQALQDLKRKRKFNPLHAKLKISPAEQTAADADVQQQQRPTAGTNQAGGDAKAASMTGASDGSSSGGTSDRPRFAARPRVAPGALQQQQQQQQQQQAAAASTKPPAQEAAAAAALGQLPAGVELLVEDDAAAAAAVDSAGYPSDSLLGKMLAELMEGEADQELSNDMLDDIPEVEALPVKLQRRKTPAQVKAAAIQQQALQQRMLRKRQAAASQQQDDDDEIPEEEESAEEQLMRAVASIQQQQQQHESSTAAGSGQAGDDEDELNWEALGQYEQLEQYLGKLKKDQQVRPCRAPIAPAAVAPLQPAASAAAAAAPPPAATAAAPPPAATAAAAQEMQPPVARRSLAAQHPSKPPAAVGSAAAAAQASEPAAAAPVGKGAKRGSKASRMDKDLDELEELVSLLEAMESGTSSSQQQGLARKPARPAAASSTAAAATAAAAADPGETLLKALLGDDWEAELLDDLAAVIDDDEGELPPQQQQQQGKLAAAAGPGSKQQQSAAAADEDEEAPWADEVTALLLGLITISHEKYIKTQISLPGFESVGEDERCAAFWQAPWALFMVDDSSESCVEYVNEAAGAMLGGGYLDLFGRPTHELVAPDLTAQADWAYAVRKVEESAQFSVQLPQLQLQSLDGQPVIARDVTMWRVDSLEDTAIGMAVLVRSWERV